MERVEKKGRIVLNNELKNMSEEILKIEKLVCASMVKVQKAITEDNLELTKEIKSDDEHINKLCIDLEKHAYNIIALQQPISGDLRLIVSIIRIIPDLERMGDHTKAIAKVLPSVKGLDVNSSIEVMLEALALLVERLDRSMDAFQNMDSVAAREIAKGDDDIDELSSLMLKKVIKEMKNDPGHIKKVSKLLLLAKSIERIGDYIVNICETTVYLNTGELVELM
ncbi:phosphate signaling complex protein PhoU [Peptostreptococcus faecalis]|uniref:phosphate signaling complex protein PhoU n=1 Tax=Peptostreptococcus faecalis TaxID=2045015 RepID=UPI000C7A32A8|nr:phosphate signaling complex protein PhoU [Peptostreptococcus faecalis]